jgi:hypothetical protein
MGMPRHITRVHENHNNSKTSYSLSDLDPSHAPVVVIFKYYELLMLTFCSVPGTGIVGAAGVDWGHGSDMLVGHTLIIRI